MQILITGVAGFIGSHVAERLISEGHRVVGLDNLDDYYDPELKKANLSNVLKSGSFEFVKGDIREKDLLEELFATNKFDLAIHLAAMTGVRPSLKNARLYYDVNVKGTLNILEIMQQHAVKKLVFASSSSVYGNNKKVPFCETDNVDYPISPYAATKKAAELLCHAYHHIYHIDVFCLRFFTVYGPRQRPDMAISKFCKRILKGEAITIFGDGSSRRDYTFIEDIVQGIVSSANHVNGYEVLNIGNGNTTSLTGLINVIEKRTGVSAIIERHPMQPGDVNVTYADIQKAKNLIGYNPKTRVEEGISKYLSWLNSNKLALHTI